MRPSLPYDDVLRQETFFLDLYISGRYARNYGARLRVPGHQPLRHGAAPRGGAGLPAAGAGRPAVRGGSAFWLENQFNGTARLLLTYRYLK